MAQKTVSPSEIPEVQEYLLARERYEQWVQANEGFLQPLRDLKEDLKTKQQAADKVVRAKGVFCGPWVQHAVKVEINVTDLVDAIGPNAFLELGGEKSTVVSYTIDRTKLDIAIANGTIPRDLAEKIRTEKISYSAPKEPNL